MKTAPVNHSLGPFAVSVLLVICTLSSPDRRWMLGRAAGWHGPEFPSVCSFRLARADTPAWMQGLLEPFYNSGADHDETLSDDASRRARG
jgi:hypothetical protein